MRIDQLVPAFHRGDAIGDTASHLKRFLSTQGFSSEIYCLTRDEALDRESEFISSFPKTKPSDVTILHFALPSPLTKSFARLPTKKVLIYHNITPPEFFVDFSQEMANISRQGRKELASLVPHVSLALADSEFNCQELRQLGFKKTAAFPLFVDFSRYERKVNRLVHELFSDGRTNILFVGRIVPNKRIEDIIRVTFYYKKYISPLVRMIVIGKTHSLPTYYQSLVRLADEFYLQPEEICFTGHIPDEEMYALYQASDVFLSLSEHEGFGLPFLESMVFDLPIIAYDSTAVPYTLMGAGVLIRHKRVGQVAELVNIVAHDEKIKQKIIQEQRQRLERFKAQELEKLVLKHIETLTESP
ncbi:MAG: glycosyltransferase [Candidatus Aminicenantes bacterium]|nr:glycosyltransferase [Candidatus Aminicenantes bacterium]